MQRSRAFFGLGPHLKECGAKTRKGARCRNAAMKNGRCRMHGGRSTGAPKGNWNARKNGTYSNRLLPNEIELWEKIKTGKKIDDMLLYYKILMRRAFLADKNEVLLKLIGKYAKELTRLIHQEVN